MTDQVIRALCERMREEQDFSALPILADALDEIGGDSNVLLATFCRMPQDWAASTKIVSSAMGGEELEAVKWIEEFATDVGQPGWYDEENGDTPREARSNQLSYSYLADLLRSNLGHKPKHSWDWGEYHTFYGYDTPERCYADREKLWEMFFVATGIPPTDERHSNLFSCSC